MTLASGTRLGPYEIVAPIGAGGMGEVYRARDTRIGRDVAIKVLSGEYSSDPDRLRRFEHEVRAAGALNHPNICTIYDIGEHEGRPFLVMELLEGQTLRERISSKRFAFDEMMELAIQIADALDAAHAKGIVHRDLKPANLFITDRRQAKILDFGLAKLAADGGASKAAPDDATRSLPELVTSPGTALGTVAYMSPEQARGQDVDARTDLFSFGMVLYEVATGAPAFKGSTTAVIFDSILNKAPVPAARVNPELPPELDRVITKALEKDRDVRYQSARDMLVDLRRLKRDSESGRSAAAPAAEHAQSRRSWAVWAGVSVLLVAAAAFYFFAGRNKAIDSLAVLPFVNAADASTEYLSDGITESLISSLSRLPNLAVRSRSSVFRYKGKDVDPQTVARDLKVRAVLTGRVAQRGDGLSIWAELVDAQNNRTLWSEQYNRKMADVMGVQDEISREISDKLRLKLTGEEQKRMTKRHTENSEAYQEYLKGRFYWNKRTAESIRTAITHFENAIAKDPQFALGYAGLADSYVLVSQYSPVRPRETLPKAKAAAEKAIALDSTLGEPYAALGAVKQSLDLDFAGAERDYKKAIELSPSYATGHQWYGEMLGGMGRFDDSVAELKRAHELDPLSLIAQSALADTYRLGRRYDQAVELHKATLALDPNFGIAHTFLGLAYLGKRMYPEAISELRQGKDLLPEDPSQLAFLVCAYGLSGNMAEAQKAAEELFQQSRNGYVPAFTVAIAYAGLGDKNRSLEWLENAVEERNDYLLQIKVDPLFDPVRSDPRFSDLLRRLNLAR